MKHLIISILSITMFFTAKASDTIFFGKNNYLINQWQVHVKALSSNYGFIANTNDTIRYMTGFGTGTANNLYKCIAGPVILSSSTNYTLTTTWTNVSTGILLTKDMFVLKTKNQVSNESKINYAYLPTQRHINIVDSNYYQTAIYTYNWSTGDTSNTIKIKSPGTYKVTVTKQNPSSNPNTDVIIGTYYWNQSVTDSIIVKKANVLLRINIGLLSKGSQFINLESLDKQ